MTTATRLLVIEDAEAIRVAVASAMRAAGHTVMAVPDGTELERWLAEFRPDLVLLDLMLPGRDGFALLEIIRSSGDTGVIVLTARDAQPDRLRGLRTGADDYVVKPFDLAELVERVAVLLRRMRRVSPTIRIDELVIDTASARVCVAGEDVELTTTERRLLDYLAAHRGEVLSKTRILTALWGYDNYDTNLVEVHISALRRKLGATGDRLLRTVRGAGYLLSGPT